MDSIKIAEVDPGLVARREQIMSEIKALEKELESVKVRIDAQAGDADYVLVNGQPALKRVVQTRRQIDLDRLRKDMPDLDERYGSTRTLTFFKRVGPRYTLPESDRGVVQVP